MKWEWKLIIFAALVSLVNASVANIGKTIYIYPEEKMVGIGDVFTLLINISSDEPVSAAVCNISFNPSILQAISVENGGMFEYWWDDLIPEPNGMCEIDNINGTISYIIASSSSENAVAEGTFAILTFMAINEGTSFVNIEDPVIQGETDVEIINGQVIVAADITPPTISLLTYPPSITNNNDVTFEWTATDDSTPQNQILYSYMLEGYDTWHPWSYSTSKTYNNLPDGSYTFKIKAKDLAGNIGYLNYSFTIDTIPPTISLLTYPPSITNNNDVTFEWTATDDSTPQNQILYSYMLEGYDTWHPWSYSTSKTYNNLPDGSYTFKIKAKDLAGNIGYLNYSFTIDTIPPIITDIVFPPVGDSGKTVTISCVVTDNVGIQKVLINITYPDGSEHNISMSKIDSTYYYADVYTMLGTYQFYIYARDTVGNWNKSNVKQFEIADLSPPNITNIVIAPPIQDVYKKVNISCVVTDNVGIQKVLINITYPDGSEHNISMSKIDSTYYYITTYTKVGTYKFYIYALDTSNNANKSIVKEFEIIDNVPPSVKVNYPKGGEFIRDVVTIKWNATDNYAKDLLITIKYSSDNGVTWHLIAEDTENDGEHKWNTSNLEDGKNYLIEISAKDASGNVGKNVSQLFTIDNTKPLLDIEKPEAGKLYIFDREIIPIIGNKAKIIGKITIVADANDETAGIEKVEFYIDGKLKKDDNTKPYEWTWDERIFFTHTIKVIAYDKAGNKISKEVEVFIINLLG